MHHNIIDINTYTPKKRLVRKHNKYCGSGNTYTHTGTQFYIVLTPETGSVQQSLDVPDLNYPL